MDHHTELFHFIPQYFAVLSTQAITLVIALLFVFLVITFLVSGAEVAFFSLTFKEVNMLKTKQQPGYKRIVTLLEQPKNLLASILISNTLARIAVIVLASVAIDEFAGTGSRWWMQLIIKGVSIAFLLILFGEVMPKVMATQNNIRFAKDAGPLVETISFLFKGLSEWFVASSDIIDKRMGAKGNTSYGLDELDHAIDKTTPTEASEKEKNILKGIVKFGNITARQVMKARLDVSGIPHESSFAEVVKRVEELHYSRLPVFRNDMDDVAGMLHTKDLLPYLHERDDFDWHQLIRPAYFIHEQKLVEDLLQEFRAKRIHFAIVVDEFGGTSGILTLEDIMEEIIGEIRDEFDEDDIEYTRIDDMNFLFNGKVMIYDVCRVMELPHETFDEVKGESETLAGLVLELAGEIPKVNEVITNGDFEFEVLEVEKNRLQKIKVTIKPQLNS